MRIFLIGMPGSGKSTAGRRLADRLPYPYFDLDEEIISQEQISVSEIFALEGEEYFRQLETQVLKELIGKYRDLILSAGGGTPCFNDNLKLMKENGTVIFLDVAVDVLLERVEKEKNIRPLLQDTKDIKLKLSDLRSKRLHYYSQSHHTVHNYDELERLFEGLLK